MSPYGRRSYDHRLLDDTAIRSAAWIAVFHMGCWASSVILGAVSIWLRSQATDGVNNSVFGIAGVGLWGSIPYLLAAIFQIRVAKMRTYLSISWLFGMSIVCLICSLGIFGFSSIVVAMEASIESTPKRAIVAGVLAGFSLVEVATSIITCVSCFSSIGCFDKMNAKGDRLKNSGPSRSRVSPGDEEPSHVTVMALPARQAAELFYTMYKPYFPASSGFGSADPSTTMHDSGYYEGHESASPHEQQRRRRHHRRHTKSGHREHETGEGGYLSESPPYVDGEYSDEDAEWNGGGGGYIQRKTGSRQPTPHRQQSDDDEHTTTTKKKSKKQHSIAEKEKKPPTESSQEKKTESGAGAENKREESKIKPTGNHMNTKHKLAKHDDKYTNAEHTNIEENGET